MKPNQFKCLLITGGTGSFGKAVLKKAVISNRFSAIRVFSRDEKKQDDLRKELKNKNVKFFIGDIRDYDSITDAISGADCVFHAAALKQVPSCEFFPLEAVKTNILGTENVLKASERYNVKKVVVLSTDKAVYPINAMGLSKAMMEKVMIARSRKNIFNNQVFCATRYGNVMASRGSVIPLFIEQIKSGQALTITEPQMTRFMMTLDESVELVMHAFDNAKPGDIFVKKSVSSTILTLAKSLLNIYKRNNKIKTIGFRHGEKLFETLISSEEMAHAEDLGSFYRIPSDNRDLNYDTFFSSGNEEIANFKEYNSHNTKILGVEEMKKLLLELDIIKNDLAKDKAT